MAYETNGQLLKYGPYEPARPYGNVYFAQPVSGGFIKIGWSTNPSSRGTSMQTFSPLKLQLLHFVQANILLERVLHERFRAVRQHGEWFEPVHGILEQIERWRITPPPDPDWNYIWPMDLPQKSPHLSHHHAEVRAGIMKRAAEVFGWS